MKKDIILSLTTILAAALVFTACVRTLPSQPTESGDAKGSSAVLGESITDASQGDIEEAYYLLVEQLWQEDDGLNEGIEYISLDLSRAKLEDTAPLLALMQDFCDKNGCKLLTLPFEQLEEQGYIEDLYFDKGVLISFEDKELTETSLKTDAKKWRSSLGAIGATYTVEKKSKGWEITGVDGSWVS